MNQSILLAQLPVKIIRLIPHSVKPDGTDRAIVRQKFGQLIIHKFIIRFPFTMPLSSGSFTCSAQRIIILTCPVQMRVIQVKFNSLLTAFFCQLLHDISFKRRSIYNIIVRIFCIKHGKAIVMTCSKANVLGPRSLDGSHPFGSIKFRRIKARSSFSVFMTVQVSIIHIPFPLGKHTIDTPMQEDTQFTVAELLTRFQISFRRSIPLLCNYIACSQQCPQTQSQKFVFRRKIHSIIIVYIKKLFPHYLSTTFSA